MQHDALPSASQCINILLINFHAHPRGSTKLKMLQTLKKYLHYSIDSTAVSLPHASKPGLAPDVPQLLTKFHISSCNYKKLLPMERQFTTNDCII